MSVRKSTLKSRPSAGVSVLRNAAFWGFLLVSSFLIGFLIISPLINAVAGPRTPGKPESAGTASVNPSPSSHSDAPAVTSETPRRRTQEDNEALTITPDRPEPRATEQPVQAAESTDGTSISGAPSRDGAETSPSTERRSRRRHTTSDTSDSATDRTDRTDRTGRDDSPATTDDTAAEAPRTSRRSTRSHRDSAATDDTTPDETTAPRSTRTRRSSRGETDASAEPTTDRTATHSRRSSRRTRETDNSETHGRTRDAGKSDVQHGEGIDN